jgi:uncharacterized protein YjbI with pentapeptide repeats
MSEYTTREILDMIEAKGAPQLLDLSGADLSSIDLSCHTIEKELDSLRKEDPKATPPWWNELTRGIHLPDANFEGVDLRYADLQGANMQGVNLQGARLEHADLRGVTLSVADLRKAKLLGARLQRVELRESRLEEAYLGQANLEGADLSFAHLEGSQLWEAHLVEAHLRYANLKGSNLQDANLGLADLSNANLGGAVLWDANLKGGTLWHTNLALASLSGANLEGARLGHANLEGAEVSGANLDAAELVGANLCEVDLRDTRSMRATYLYRAVLDRTQLTRAQLGDGVAEELRNEWRRAKEAYLALKNNFEQLGRYDDASWAYRKERRMEKWEAWQEAREALSEREWRPFVSKTWKVGWDLVVEYLCDYGENVGRILGWMGFVLLIAGPLLFGLPGLLNWPPDNRDTFFGLHSPWRYGYAYLQQFLYVLDAFTTASFAELQPATAVTRALSGLAALIGVFLTGLLGFVAGNRIRRS